MAGGFWRWLRTMPQARWSWPRTVRSRQRRAGAAELAALRFTTQLGDELQIRNDGPGDAADITVTVLHRSPAGQEQRSLGGLANLGAGSRYIVSLRPGGGGLERTGAGRWVWLHWRNVAGDQSDSWAFAGWDTPLGQPLTPLDPSDPWGGKTPSVL